MNAGTMTRKKIDFNNYEDLDMKNYLLTILKIVTVLMVTWTATWCLGVRGLVIIMGVGVDMGCLRSRLVVVAVFVDCGIS